MFIYQKCSENGHFHSVNSHQKGSLICVVVVNVVVVANWMRSLHKFDWQIVCHHSIKCKQNITVRTSLCGQYECESVANIIQVHFKRKKQEHTTKYKTEKKAQVIRCGCRQ